jgi:predicted Zn-dependent peptidase
MEPKFYRKVLKNGMTLLLEKRDMPVVSVAFAVRYGGINETLNERGIAHFIEHMLYKGTKKRSSKQISHEIEKNGGIMNGFTEEPLTAYWCKMPSDKLDIALNVLSDMVKNPLFDAKEMEKERKVIFEEMKMRKDNPMQYVFDEIQSCLYKNPLGTSLIGTYESMNSIDRKKIVGKFQQVYKTENMIFCVVGDADFDKLEKFAEKNFKKKKGKIERQKIILQNNIKVEKRKGINQTNLVLAFHSPLATNKKVYAAKLLIVAMAHGLSSRLFHEIRDKRNMAYSIFGDVSASKDFSYSFVYAGIMKENLEKVKKLILEEFQKVSRNLSEKEFSQAKEQIIGNYKTSMENSESQMHQLLFSEMDGMAKDFYEFEKNIRDVKLKDVKKLAQIKKYSFFALVPE